MSIYTTTDRDNVKEAIINLASGKRVVSTEVGGKEREYHQTSLNALKVLLVDIVADIAAASESSGSRRSKTTLTSDTW